MSDTILSRVQLIQLCHLFEIIDRSAAIEALTSVGASDPLKTIAEIDTAYAGLPWDVALKIEAFAEGDI